MLKFLKKSIPKRVKRFLNKELQKRINARILKLPPVDWTGIQINPIEAAIRTKRSPVLLEVPLAKCRGLRAMAFPCDAQSNHPFIVALLANDMTLLQQYFNLVQPATIGELFDIKSENPIIQMPALSYVYPWDGMPSVSIRKYRKVFVSNETKRHGGSRKFEGWHHFGPVSTGKVRLEFQRLTKIYESIKNNGYQRSDEPDGDIAGVLLLKDNDFRVVIQKGHHRIAALAALGYSDVPVRIGLSQIKFINVASVEEWPGVRSSIFTPREASQIFNRIYNGFQPAVCEAWHEFCKKYTEP